MFRSLFKRAQSKHEIVSRALYSTNTPDRQKTFWTLPKLLVATPTVLLGAWIATSEHPRASATLAVNFPVRLGRDVACATSIVLDYHFALKDLQGEKLDDEWRRCHLRSADKLQRLCFANGGVYIKLGQVAAQLDHLLPEEYVVTLRNSMLDKCPVSTFAQVVRTINDELGAPPSALFAEFEEEPVASASLAQVHRAIGFDGKELAVKVQHPGLLDTYAADVATVSALVRIVHLIFPKFDYSWLVSEFKATLPMELDFVHEADNAERCARNFRGRTSRVRDRVHVPAITRKLSTQRVLTMEYIRGTKVTDKELLEQQHIQPLEVAQLVSEAFNEMIFIFGDVHCDPHAANMLIRRDARGRPQLVLLDHGLYKRLDDTLRLEYAGLWQALVFGDVKGIRRHSAGMNVGDMFPLFAAMLTQRTWEDVTRRSADHLAVARGRAEREQLQQRAKAAAREINELLGKMPRDLLLLLKTNDCLRAVDLALEQPVNTFTITARECSRALAQHRANERPGLSSWLRGHLDAVRTEWRLTLLQAFTWWSQMRIALHL